MKPTLHYIHDPFCGWCYAAAPLVRAAREVPGLTVVAHGGGMMTGARRTPATAMRGYVIPHDKRIAAMTGQVFGDAYFDGLLRDPQAIFDSLPPTTALVAVQALVAPDEADKAALDFLARLQTAHYAEGRRIADTAVLRELAIELGHDGAAFDRAFAQAQGDATDAHIAASRALLNRAGGQGFPTFAIETDKGLWRVDTSSFLGNPAAWAEALQQALTELGAPAASDADDAPACGLDGCAIPDAR